MQPAEKMRPGALRDCTVFIALALAVRATLLFATPRVIDTADAVHYIGMAKYFATGDAAACNPKIPLLYPLLMSVAHAAIPDYEWAGVLISLIASALLIVPVYGLSRDLHGRGAARVAALLCVIWPWLVDYAGRVGPDALGCTLWFCCMWTFARAMRRGGVWVVAAAAAFFALHLTRAEGTMLVLAALAAAPLLMPRDDCRKLRRLIPFAAIIGALLLGYALYMRSMTGGVTLNYRVQFIVREFDAARFAATALRTFSDVLPVMLGPVLLLFCGVGLFHRTSNQRDVRLELYVLYFAGCQWVCSLFVLSPEPRYLMSVIVALSLWSARGIVIVANEARALKWGRCLGRLPIAAVVLLMILGNAIPVGAQFLHRRPSEPLEYKIAGRWMKEHLEPGLMFTRKPIVAYYADMPSTGPDLNDTVDQALDRARRAGARYLVVDERYTAPMVRGLAPLLDPASAPAGLHHLKTFEPYPQSRVVVYEIARDAATAPQ